MINDNGLYSALVEGRPYFGPRYACAQGRPERHVYFRALVGEVHRHLPPGPLHILEIGSWAGGSAVTWAKALQDTGRPGQIWCVDSWRPYFDLSIDRAAVYQEMNDAAAAGDIQRIFHHNIRTCGVDDRVVVLKGESKDVLPMLSPGTFDIIFIDGSHSYADVVSDIESSLRLLKDGGVLCGDDFELDWRDCDAAALAAAVQSGVDYAEYDGHSFHPGVTAAIRDTVRTISSFEGFWVARIDGGQATTVALEPTDYSVPEHLLQPDLQSVAIEAETDTHNVLRVGEKYIAVARSLGVIDLFQEPVGSRELAPLLLIDDDLARLRARVADLDSSTRRPAFELLEERSTHVIVRGGERVYGVSRNLGAIDLLSERLGEREIPGVLLIESDEHRLRARLAEIEATADRPTFVRIEERATHVLVRGGDKVYAVPRALGPVDLLHERLGEREIPHGLLIDEDENRLRERLVPIEAVAQRPHFELLEERATHVLVRGGDRVYAVARALGQVDLLGSRLGEQELPGVLLIDEDENRLRERLAPIEAVAQRPHFELLEERATHVLVRGGDKVYAVARALGQVDLLGSRLGEQELPGVLLIDEDENRLRERLAPIEAVAHRPHFELLEERATHVLVRGGDKVYAVARALGQVDLLGSRLGEQELPGVLLIDNDEARLRERLAEIEAAARRPVFDVIEEGPTHVLIRGGEKVYAVARTLGPIDILESRIGECEIPPVLLIDTDERRLRDRLADIQSATHRPNFELIEERPTHLVVRGDDKVYAVARELGPVDLLAERLGEREIQPALLIDTDENLLRQRLAVVEARALRPVFTVIEERETHILVRGGDTLYAVSRTLGPVDLLAERLGEREVPGVLLIDDDEGRLRSRVVALETETIRPVFAVIEECGTYMLVRGGDVVYAVSRLLGAVDLLAERLGERELPGILLVDTDETRLRARVEALEAERRRSVEMTG